MLCISIKINRNFFFPVIRHCSYQMAEAQGLHIQKRAFSTMDSNIPFNNAEYSAKITLNFIFLNSKDVYIQWRLVKNIPGGSVPY